MPNLVVVCKVFATLNTIFKVLIISVKLRSVGPTGNARVTSGAPTDSAETEITTRPSRTDNVRTIRYAR